MWIFQSMSVEGMKKIGEMKGKAAAAALKKTEEKTAAEMKYVRKTIASMLEIARGFRSDIVTLQINNNSEYWRDNLKLLDKDIRPKVEKACDKIEAAAKKAKTLSELNAILKDATWLSQFVGDKNWATDNKKAYEKAYENDLSYAKDVFDKYLPKEKEGFMK
ncbi:MAG: hypothetical protein NTX79_07925 [Candidatus Micrarchaeota archaeon]|nr:hypothetical protein [Candidatus Micrarchaeota archaeon]